MASQVLWCFLALYLFYLGNCDTESYLHDPNHVHNQQHLREHMQDMLDTEELDKLKLDSSEEMEFHYFKLHDYDNNNKLDGLELMAAMTHYHESGPDGKQQAVDIDEDELSRLVETILGEDDLNDDGYIDYYEFVQAQRRATQPPPPTDSM